MDVIGLRAGLDAVMKAVALAAAVDPSAVDGLDLVSPAMPLETQRPNLAGGAIRQDADGFVYLLNIHCIARGFNNFTTEAQRTQRKQKKRSGKTSFLTDFVSFLPSSAFSVCSVTRSLISYFGRPGQAP